eukprot:132304_1
MTKCCDCNNMQKLKCCNKIQNLISNPHFMLMMQTIWNRNILYYQQALSQVFSSSPFVILFGVFSQIFNLSLTNNYGNHDNGWCFMNGLDSKQKILTDLLIPFLVILWFTLFYIISKCTCNGVIIFCKKRQI